MDGLLQAEGECSAQSVGKACPAGVASEAGDGFMQVFLNDFDAGIRLWREGAMRLC